MATNNGFKVPKAEQQQYKLLVQRANRTVNSNVKYLNDYGITNDRVRRDLLGDFDDPLEWASRKTAFSRSIQFENEKAYRDYKRHLERFAGVDSERGREGAKQRVYENIIKSLNTTADIYGQGVKDESGHLPKELTDRLKGMTHEQLLNFFDVADPHEDIEHQSWSYEEYQEGVDRATFIDITMTRLNYLEEIVPKRKKKTTKKKKTIKKKKKK